jgi:isocitrate dehydrogenase (NAD+)
MRIGVIQGNGIGPEIIKATQYVLEATGLSFQWIPVMVGDEAVENFGHPLPQESINVLHDLRVASKGPLIVEKLIGRLRCVHADGTEHMYPSLNNAIRRELNLFVCVRPVHGIPHISNSYESMDVVILREITEDVYAGIEYQIEDCAAECIKLTTRTAASRVSEYAFNFAKNYGRKKVTCVHKANAISITDGLFLRCFREIAEKNSDIEYDDCMVDAAAYHLVKNYDRFDIIVTSNQYGDILSDLCAGLIGSLGLVPGANIGDEVAVFEASHGAAPDIAGKGIANPLAMILSGALMLRHLGYCSQSKAVEESARELLAEKKILTPDLGGTATCMELSEAIAKRVAAKIKT